MSTPHIAAEPGDFAATVLMPGDPQRARFIAEAYLDDVRQVTDVRSISGFTGNVDGRPLSVLAHGIG
ncbi:MAG: purine-nucleoside phosphorylase, partial [Acidimicrobiia bacterium]|nr:purine-nucleoside phosphorylase [Acidimicrobiia bacterium]